MLTSNEFKDYLWYIESKAYDQYKSRGFKLINAKELRNRYINDSDFENKLKEKYNLNDNTKMNYQEYCELLLV